MHVLEIPLSGSTPGRINFAALGDEDIIQCLTTLFRTAVGSVPLDRDIGVDYSPVDLPMNVGIQALRAEFVAKCALYEPRVKIRGLDFTGEGAIAGTLTAIVRWEHA